MEWMQVWQGWLISPFWGLPREECWWWRWHKQTRPRTEQRQREHCGRGYCRRTRTRKRWCSSRSESSPVPPLSNSTGRRLQWRSWTAKRTKRDSELDDSFTISRNLSYDSDDSHNDGSLLDVHVLVVLHQRSLVPGHLKRLHWSGHLRPTKVKCLSRCWKVWKLMPPTLQLSSHVNAPMDSIGMSTVSCVRNSSWWLSQVVIQRSNQRSFVWVRSNYVLI